MGFTPREVDQMSMWQFNAVVEGFVRSRTPKAGASLSDQEKDVLFDWIDGASISVVAPRRFYAWDGRTVSVH